MKRLGSESGQTLIMVAIGMTVIIGFVAFATDVGIQLRNKRLAQTAADAAAIAGTAQLLNTAPTSALVTAAGQAAVQQNGFPATAVVMTYPYNGQPSDVEATVQQSSSTIFMGMFGHSSMTVSARAVATLGQGNNCVFALSTAGTALTGSNNGKIDVPGCGVQDNSSLVSVVGSANITAKSIGVAGTAGQNSGSINNNGSTSPGVTYGVAPVGDPLASLTAPSYNASSCTTALTLNQWSGPLYGTLAASQVNEDSFGDACYGAVTLNGGSDTLYNPGVFIINGDLTIDNGATANLGCGLYYITGNFQMQGNGLNGGSSTCGVTFYVLGKTINISNGGVVKLIAPTSGTYNGMLFWQASNSGATINLAGGANSLFEGVIYSPQGSLQLNNGTDTNVYADVVVGSINFQGGENFYNYQVLPGTSNPIKAVKLIE